MILRKLDNRIQNRHLHPSIYQKYIKTKDLIKKGVDPEEYRDKGGIDLKTFEALRQRRQDQELLLENSKERFKSQYGSISSTPISVGPCKKIDPVIGTKNALVLLTEFKDKKHTIEPQFFEKLLFSKGSNKSMRDYYLEASWKQLEITGKVINPWFTADGVRADYVDEVPVNKNYPKAQRLVKETILQAKEAGVDFTPFSKDGKIELLIMVFADMGLDREHNIKYIRPHQGRLTDPIEVQKDIWADRYCLISELPKDDLGVFCHEVGHLLGLPDMYKEGYSPIVGQWCLMGIGDHIDDGKTPAHPSAWCKTYLGWKKPEIIDKPPEIHEIPAVADDDGTIYKIEVEGSGGKEYFLMENRQRKGFDSKLPGSGLLIWHINEDRCVYQPPNSDPEHFFLTLIQSDGKNELLKDMTSLNKELGEEEATKLISGDEGDAYPGETLNRSFDEKSIPNSDSYDGKKSLVSITSISDSQDKMQAHMGLQHQYDIAVSSKPTISQINPSVKMIQSFMTMMASDKEKSPVDDGYEDGINDVTENLKEKNGLNSYVEGYRKGYLWGFKTVFRKLK